MTDPRRDGAVATILWAIFLGCSWTWVIGMFLPVLLVRDYGLAGWVVFAVPNVIGAAALAWVLRDAGASERFAARHAAMCYAFSVVTIAYHLFFAMWMIERIKGWGWMALGFYVLAAVVPANNRVRWAGAVFALVASAVMWWMLYQQRNMLRLPRAHEGLDAMWLLPAFILGFGLCPYLDLTFHRARQNLPPAGGRLAFALGFGVVFLAMIVFSLLYAHWVRVAARGQDVSPLSALFLCIHFMAQSAFTVAAHARELHGRRVFGKSMRRVGVVVLAFLGGAVALGTYASRTDALWHGRQVGEVVYWCFLGFYGLVFPTYVWATGWRHWSGGLTGRAKGVIAVCALIALPMYWMGFVERKPVWLIPAAVVILVSRALVRRRV